jgi:hypothetical protein
MYPLARAYSSSTPSFPAWLVRSTGNVELLVLPSNFIQSSTLFLPSVIP